jgi:hypothetical protein
MWMTLSDRVGNWDQRYAGIEIKEGGIGGLLKIEGIAAFKGARDVHTGAINAQVMPHGETIAFLDGGWLPFETNAIRVAGCACTGSARGSSSRTIAAAAAPA